MTAQVADTIRFAGARCALMSNPLESLFDQGHPRPGFVPESTAKWRGYVAHWELEDDALFLVGVDGQVWRTPSEESQDQVEPDDLQEFSLDDLFPGGSGRVCASWFTGTLHIPTGELVKYVHMGFQSRYERYITLDLESGRLVRTAIISDAELQRQEADACLGKVARMLKRFARLWVGYSAMSSRAQQVAQYEVLDDRELIRRVENCLAEARKRVKRPSSSASARRS